MVDAGEKLKKLKIPSYPKDDQAGHRYTCNTIEEKTVCKYTGLNIYEIEDLNVFEFWLYLRDAVVYNCMQTEEGKKYLDDCWRMDQTEPDRNGLRNKLGSI